MKRVLLAALLYAALTVPAHALVDISSKVQVIKGPPTFNYVTNQTSVSLSVKNISAENLQTPVRVTLDSISPIAVVCANPDGVDSNGKPFFLLTLGSAIEIKLGETSNSKPILFSNPKRLRFNFTPKAYISTPENTMNNFVAAISNENVDLALKEMDDMARDRYQNVLTSVLLSHPEFLNDFADRSLIFITDVLAKYELRLQEAGEEVVYDVFMYKNTKGEWKIYQM